jgi:hypothetical protein
VAHQRPTPRTDASANNLRSRGAPKISLFCDSFARAAQLRPPLKSDASANNLRSRGAPTASFFLRPLRSRNTLTTDANNRRELQQPTLAQGASNLLLLPATASLERYIDDRRQQLTLARRANDRRSRGAPMISFFCDRFARAKYQRPPYLLASLTPPQPPPPPPRESERTVHRLLKRRIEEQEVGGPVRALRRG